MANSTRPGLRSRSWQRPKDRTDLDGGDLRGVNAEYTHFGLLCPANLDGAGATNVYLTDVESCTFRKTVLH